MISWRNLSHAQAELGSSMLFKHPVAAGIVLLWGTMRLLAVESTDAAASIPATTSSINSPAPLSERVVYYDIDARYDANKHSAAEKRPNHADSYVS